MLIYPLFILALTIKLTAQKWVLFYNEFFNDQFEQYDITEWNKSIVRKCGIDVTSNGNDIFSSNQFGALGNSGVGQTTQRTLKAFPPHFQIEVDIDILALGTGWTGQDIKIYLGPDTLFQFPHTAALNILNICPLVSNQQGLGYIKTVYRPHDKIGDLQLIIDDYYAPTTDFSVKNLFIYLNMCDYSCASCNGDTSISCLTCPTGASKSGTSCQCNASLFAYMGVCRTTCPAGHLQDSTQRLCVPAPYWLTVYNSFQYDDFQNVDVDWTFTPAIVNYVTSCGSNIRLVGGYPLFQTQRIDKSFTNLPPHTTLRVGAKIVKIDTWQPNYTVKMQVQGYPIQTITVSATDENLGNICGNPSSTAPEYQKYVEYVISHTASSITVSFYSDTIVNGVEGNWGVREIFIDVQSCFINCQTCASTTQCTACVAGYYLLNGQCYQTGCPLFANQSGFTCTEKYLALFTKGLYILQSLWWTYFTHNDINNVWGYTFSGFFSDRRYNLCRNTNIIGGWGVGASETVGVPLIIQQNFATVAPHWQMRIIAELYLIDNWDANDKLDMIIDNSATPAQTVTKTSANSPNNICGNYSVNDQLTIINLVLPHSITSLNLQFKYTSVTGKRSVIASFGLGEVDIIIDQCPDGCLTCTSSTACQSCLPNWYFLQDAQACFQDCTNIPPRSNFMNKDITPSDVARCVCQSGYYYSLANINCLSCSYKCTQCTGPNDADCTVCADRRQQTGVCNCPDLYYDIPNNPICGACNTDCATCQGAANNCLSCSGNKIQTTLNGPCVCPTKKYSQGAGFFCADCAKQCGVCSNTAAYCTSCPLNSNRVQPTVGDNSCKCQDGYYDDGTEICKICDKRCLTCSGTAKNCINCNINLYYQQLNTLCVCVDGRYEDVNGDCQPCQDFCDKCSGPGPSGCLRCQGTRIGSTCSCQSNQYTIPGVVDCYDCSYKCVGCSIASTNCTKCDPSRNQDATCSCPSGYYDQSGIPSCQKCVAPCSTCTSDTACITCQGNNRGGSNCGCLPGYFQVSGDINCQKCNPKCATCEISADNCLTCSPGRITSDCICPSQTWDSGSNAECLKCYVSCDTCTGGAINQCKTCKLGFIYDSVNAMCKCPDKQFIDQTGYCANCYYSCAQCKDGTSTGCLKCQDKRNLTSQGTCVCQTDYQEIGQTCVLTNIPIIIPDNCLVCKIDNVCQECKPTFEQDLGNCVCPRGTYLSNISKTCISCPYSCETCFSDSECLDCKSSFYLDNQQMCQQEATQSDSYETSIIIVSVLFGLFFVVAAPIYYWKGIKKMQNQYNQLNNNTKNNPLRRDSHIIVQNLQ